MATLDCLQVLSQSINKCSPLSAALLGSELHKLVVDMFKPFPYLNMTVSMNGIHKCWHNIILE